MSSVSRYLDEALSEIPRLLSLLDRNMDSPTFGSFYRPYWHDKATDVPCAHAQMGVLPLALVYSHDLNGNVFHRNPKILRWIVASMKFWREMQNSDGSFDEHYPNEHSYGATAWSLYGMLESFSLVKREIDSGNRETVFESMTRAAKYLSRSDEPRVLTNHQAIAALNLHMLHSQTSDKTLLNAGIAKLNKVLSSQSDEGWFMEYDGPDFGYLTTTISFLAKLYRRTGEERIFRCLEKAIDFASYFVYPDGSFGGTLGSRHTEHFHPHGFEIMGGSISMATAVADKILSGILRGRIITPRRMDDKYFVNQVIEYIQSFKDAAPRPELKPELPYERQQFVKHFAKSGLLVVNKGRYIVIATQKGCIFKVFDKKLERPLLVDSGFVGLTDKGRLLCTQWPDCSLRVQVDDRSVFASGRFRAVNREILSPFKMVLSRLALLALAWHGRIAFELKTAFIDRLIASAKESQIQFRRSIEYGQDLITIEDRVIPFGKRLFKSLALASEFCPRYVPASEYFELNHLASDDIVLTERLGEIDQGELVVHRSIQPSGTVDVVVRVLSKGGRCHPE